MHSKIVLVIALLLPLSAHAQRGVPVEGFPSWQERMMLVLANRARAQPTAERYNACGISTVRAPLIWGYDLNRAARFHSANMARTNSFDHDSPCTLVPNISDLFAPNGTCDGSASCACVGGTISCNPTCTDFAGRLSLFGVSGGARSENIARGQTSPREVHDGWMDSSGHCANLLGDYSSFGGGWVGSSWTQNFSSAGSPDGTLIAGGHEPQSPGTAPTNVEFRVNYYDTRGAPVTGVINIDSECAPMSLERGSATNGTYLATMSLTSGTCHRYLFVFEDPSGEPVYLPEFGSYGVGGFGCEDWSFESPLPCGALEVDPPTVVVDAYADPNPVISTNAVLRVEGDHESGEASLLYTWSAEGPADVSFSHNGSNEAKTTVATFTGAGTYSIEALITDRQGQPVSSTVEVEVVPQFAITVLPRHANVAAGESRQFSASAGLDQFGNPPPEQVGFTWSVGGGGTIDQGGLFVAGDILGGPHTVRASGAGSEGSATVRIVDSDVDTTPPEVWITHPVDGQIVTGVVHFTAEATDNDGVARVSFYVNGQLMGSSLEEPFRIDWNTHGWPEAEIEILARAFDHSGNDATSPTVRVRVVDATGDTTPPTVTIVSPLDGELIREQLFWISADADDDLGVAEVAFEIDGEIVGAALAQPWEIEIDLSDNTQESLTIVAIAKDLGGNTTRSDAVRVDIDWPGGCGCSAKGPGSSSALMLMLLALGFHIFRRTVRTFEPV